MLEEIRQQDIVEEFSAPVFSLQLVLSVPQHAKERHMSTGSDIVKTASSQSSYLKQAFMDNNLNKKTVKFEHDSSGNFTRWIYNYTLNQWMIYLDVYKTVLMPW